MIRVARFCESTATELGIEIEKFIKSCKITKEQIISLNYAVYPKGVFPEKALLMYEDNDK